MPWNEFPIVRVLIPFIIGICLGVFHLLGFYLPLWFFIFIAFTVSVASFVLKRFINLHYNFYIGILLNVLFMILGIYLSQDYYGFRQKNYFANYISFSDCFIGEIEQAPLEKEKSHRLVLKILARHDSISTKACFGRAIVYIKKDSLPFDLRYGDVLLVKNNFQEIASAQNPLQFDSKKFFKIKGIQHQAFVRETEWKRIQKANGFSLIQWSLRAQEKMLEILKSSMSGEDEFAVASALILGYRSDISEELMQAYAGSGAMHVLSVSGLHVGIIYMMLNFILELFPFFKRKSKTKTILLLFVIWAFAFITGLSPSVLRAATMISFVIIGSNINRPTSVYNSIAVSALLLLIYNPFLLFDLGFQLSYLAVISIVSLQPSIQNLWLPNNKILSWSWSLISVSLAAQIGTIPLSFLYFHQFPNVFLLTNFIVIPGAFVILMVGVLTLIFWWWHAAAWLLGWLLNFLVHWLNFSICFLEQLPNAVLRSIRFDSFQFVFLSLFIISISVALIHKQKRTFIFSLIILVIYLGYDTWVRNENKQRIEWVIYTSQKQSVMAFFDQNKLSYFADTSVINNFKSVKFQTDNQRISYGMDDFDAIDINSDSSIFGNSFFKSRRFFGFGSKRALIISKSWPSPKASETYYIDFLILDDNPDLYIPSTLEIVKPQLVIITARNKSWKTMQWKEQLSELKIPFYDISEKGAFSCVLY